MGITKHAEGDNMCRDHIVASTQAVPLVPPFVHNNSIYAACPHECMNYLAKYIVATVLYSSESSRMGLVVPWHTLVYAVL